MRKILIWGLSIIVIINIIICQMQTAKSGRIVQEEGILTSEELEEYKNVGDKTIATFHTYNDNTFDFKIRKLGNVYIENNAEETIRWYVKEVGSTWPLLGGSLEKGEVLEYGECLVEKGKYQIFVDSIGDETLNVKCEITQLDEASKYYDPELEE